MTTPEELKARIADDGVEFIYAMFVEMHGKPCAKLVPVTAIDDLLEVGAGFAGFAAGPLSQTPADPDILAIPDPDSYTQFPWQPNVAAMQCDATVEGELWPYAPRVILQRAIARAAGQNLVLKAGAEAEYSLLRRNDDGSLSVADERDTSMVPCYDARGLTAALDHLTTVSRHMDAMGWGNYANDHEDANGQFEQNFLYSDALTTSDRLIVLRLMMHTLARRQGLYATFMPKPFADKTGSGLHLHLSLTSGGNPVFPADPAAEDRRGLGLSETAYGFIGGVLDHACALQAVVAPTVNSYKRTGATSTSSGASWAPRLPTYGGNDRTHYIRVPDCERIELRGGDGSANPYLAIAAALGAGIDGIKRSIDPGAVGGGNGTKALPPTLLHAVEEFEADPVVTAAGDGVAGYFAGVKREEFFAYHSAVSPWEIDNYLTAF